MSIFITYKLKGNTKSNVCYQEYILDWEAAGASLGQLEEAASANWRLAWASLGQLEEATSANWRLAWTPAPRRPRRGVWGYVIIQGFIWGEGVVKDWCLPKGWGYNYI